MKTIIFIGSPRAEKSNSLILARQFLLGYGDVLPVFQLADTLRMEEHVEAYHQADIVLIFFPLYCDSMPGIVKLFFEKVSQLDARPGRKLGFVVQSGFPETVHALSLEPYLGKLALRLKCQYLGTVVKAGVEGIQIMPAAMTRKLFADFRKLGAYFAQQQQFDPLILHTMRKPYRMSRGRQAFMRLLSYTGLTNFYWDMNLKKHKAFEKRFDKPFV